MESQRNIKAKHQKKESRKMLILRDSFFNFQPNVFRLKRRERLSNLCYLKISHNRKYLLITSLLQS